MVGLCKLVGHGLLVFKWFKNNLEKIRVKPKKQGKFVNTLVCSRDNRYAAMKDAIPSIISSCRTKTKSSVSKSRFPPPQRSLLLTISQELPSSGSWGNKKQI